MPIRGIDGTLISRTSTRPPRTKKKRTIRNKRSTPYIRSSQQPGRVRVWKLYVLKLEGGMFYVGITAYKDVMHRYNQHASGKGAVWTRIHKPIEIIETRPLGMIPESDAVKVETEVTMDYMRRYSPHRVRGGVLCLTNAVRNAEQFNRHSVVTVRADLRYEPIFNELRWLLKESST